MRGLTGLSGWFSGGLWLEGALICCGHWWGSRVGMWLGKERNSEGRWMGLRLLLIAPADLWVSSMCKGEGGEL